LILFTDESAAMVTLRIPCVLMRGGTSRGPFFLAADLPAEPAGRDAVLVGAMGAGHALQIDGLGGGNALTSKVAIVGPATVPGADVDYLFAQVKVLDRAVDTSPNCGNMLAAVGPFAIEQGLVPARPGSTAIRIHNVNTGKIIEARVATPDGRVTYDGSTAIDGVPGTAAPVYLAFVDAAGSRTSGLFPTGETREIIDGVAVTCVDAAMPLVVMEARSLGKTGAETPDELDADSAFMSRLEAIRREAGRRMGLGDVSGRVIPKPVLVSPARAGGTFSARYFMPASCHKALAVTGGVALATAATSPGTVLERLFMPPRLPVDIAIEHPSGRLLLHVEQEAGRAGPTVSVVRTARRIFEGTLLVPLPDTAPAAAEAA
jgi:2-methylaconitate cis-trans-isomerase PrpF